jgi:hypothetical protein
MAHADPSIPAVCDARSWHITSARADRRDGTGSKPTGRRRGRNLWAKPNTLLPNGYVRYSLAGGATGEHDKEERNDRETIGWALS